MQIHSILKKLLKEGSIYSLGPVLQIAVSFFLIPIYTRYLTVSDYGSLELVLAIATFLAPVIDGGLTSSFWKFGTGEKKDDQRKVLFNCLVAQLTITLIIIAIATILFILQPSSETIRFFAIYTSVLLVRTILSIIYLNLQSTHRAVLYVVLSVTTATLIAITNILMVVQFRMGVLGIIYGNLVGLLISALIFFPINFRSLQPKFDWTLLKEMYKYGFPLVIGNLAFLVLTTSDRFFISNYSSQRDLGLYAYGVKFSTLMNTLIISPFFLGFNPIRWEIYAREDAKQVFANLYRYINSALMTTYFFFVAGGMILGTLMTGNPEFVQGLTVVPLLCFSLLLYGLYYFRAMGLLFEKKTKFISLIILFASVISLSSNFILVPLFSYHGAALASSLSYLIMFIVCSTLSQRFYPIKINHRLEISGILLAGLLCLFSVFLRDSVTPLVFGMIALSCGIIYTSILSFIFRKNIFALIRRIMIDRNSTSTPTVPPVNQD